MEWSFERIAADVHTLHHLGAPEPAVRTVRWCQPERPAIVLGSTQPGSDIDRDAAAALGVDVVRRRSGGGAVLVEDEDTTWVDVFVPAGDPLWTPDVGQAFLWLGDVWVQLLHELGVNDAEVHRGALVTTPWSRLVCFAGLGPGEVTVTGKKLVGMSQRRTREGALFQCSLYRTFRTERLLSLLAIDPAERSGARTAIEATVGEVEVSGPQVMTLLKALLPTS